MWNLSTGRYFKCVHTQSDAELARGITVLMQVEIWHDWCVGCSCVYVHSVIASLEESLPSSHQPHSNLIITSMAYSPHRPVPLTSTLSLCSLLRSYMYFVLAFAILGKLTCLCHGTRTMYTMPCTLPGRSLHMPHQMVWFL